MKKALIVLPLIALMLLAPVMAKPTSPAANLNLPQSEKHASLTVTFNQAQFQWRGVSDFGDWTPGYSYLEYATSSDFNATGNVMHTAISYSPLVENLQGNTTVYVYDKSEKVWVQKEGQVTYVYVEGYGDTQVVNFWRGYLDFGGEAPSDETLVHGVAYQWAYLYLPEDATLSGTYTPSAKWDSTIGAWLVGFSIYLWDKTPQSYDLAFPSTFIEPVPANNYNPLDL